MASSHVAQQTGKSCRAHWSLLVVGDGDVEGGGVATAVTSPVRALRWWVALSSMPTGNRPGPACIAAAIEPTVSARTAEAPPCSNPYGWVLPATGMRATTSSGPARSSSIPMVVASGPRNLSSFNAWAAVTGSGKASGHAGTSYPESDMGPA